MKRDLCVLNSHRTEEESGELTRTGSLEIKVSGAGVATVGCVTLEQ